MPGSADERAPLLQFPGSFPVQQFSEQPDLEAQLPDAYRQFCYLVGNRPTDHPPNKSYYPPKDSLYHRALEHRKAQGRMYAFTSALTNTMLLSQIVLGASLTGMGASNSPGWLITLFGALNTIIAGLVAFLKSRGQPMRARMFRDDLDRVVDEIENSATMWRGISRGVHGYDAIDTDEAVTVRSEVARLTRLYDRAVKTNTVNNPDYYGGAGVGSDSASSGLRSRPGQPALPAPPAPVSAPAPDVASAPAPLAPLSPSDPDESPATKAPAATPPKQDSSSTAGTTLDGVTDLAKPVDQTQSQPTSGASTTAPDPASSTNSALLSNPAIPPLPPPNATPAPAPLAVATIVDPDASPATAMRPPGADRTKSNKQTTKVTEDLSQDQGQAKKATIKTS